MALRDTVKPWFETGDKPTQQQFWTLFSYLWFKDESLAIGNITNLQTTLNGKVEKSLFDAFFGGIPFTFTGDNYYDIPAGYLLEKFIIAPDGDSNIMTGFSAGTDDVTAETLVTATYGRCFAVDVPALYANRRVYFTGITGNTKVIIYLRKVNLT